MFNRFKLLLYTLGHLRWTQIKYQIWYRLRKPKSFAAYRSRRDPAVTRLRFVQKLPVYPAYLGKKTFSFLNKEKYFPETIDWTFSDYGSLWQYNLQYGNYWLQENISPEEKKDLIRALYYDLAEGKLALQPYPVSLRLMNGIRLYAEGFVPDREMLEAWETEFNFLSGRLEFHLLGNHLLENLFALLMASAFFGRKKQHDRAKRLLYRELNEQILPDGAHFELSPMYHQIMLFRILELLDWYSAWDNRDERFLAFCRGKAVEMAAWLRQICFANGEIPLFNDAARDIAFSTEFLLDYAATLDLPIASRPLKDSGYRSFKNEHYEIKIDAAPIGAPYQPGHAHADALSFMLYHSGKPLLVEQGTSTYAVGPRRAHERSTQAHNTVAVAGKNQSEIWSGFRVGRRAKITVLEDKPTCLAARHDGYKKLGVIHQRTFVLQEIKVLITDRLTNGAVGVFYLHLYPGCTLKKQNENEFLLNETIGLVFRDPLSVIVEDYEYAEHYYASQKSKRLVVQFKGELETMLSFEEIKGIDKK